jgi:enoyl-CoA hydratase/carnithine racemase
MTRPFDGVALVTIDDPPSNSLSDRLYAALADVVDVIEADASIRSVVFASAHRKIFVSGADLKRMYAVEPDPADVAFRVDRAHRLLLRIEWMATPSVAAIQGHALGGGCELALAMDFRYMDRGRATIGLPEASLGLIPAAGGTQRITRLLGRTRATELMLLARRVDAGEAARIGLITAASDDALADALDTARRLADMPASSMRLIKQCINDGADGDLVDGLAVERASAIEAFTLPEAREGIAAFCEGRVPEFHPPSPEAERKVAGG